MIILLDTGVLSQVANPTPKSESTKACTQWFRNIQRESILFGIPEICDYESRREFFQGNKLESIGRLDELKQDLNKLIYFPLETEIIQTAAWLWGKARNKGIVLADKKALDGDVILIATAIAITKRTDEKVVIATTDENDLENFNNKMLVSLSWEKITFEFCIAYEMGKVRFDYGEFY